LSVRVTWLRFEERLEHEFRQLREEGVDASSLEREWALTPSEARVATAARLLDEARVRSEALHPPVETEPVFDAAPISFLTADLEARILAGWTGRMAGCLLGKPVEKVPRAGIRAILESSGAWPLNDYFTADGVPSDVTERYPWNRASRGTSLRENIVCMPEDDDINYAMLNLHVLESAGLSFTTDDVGKAWLEMLPALTVFTAERVAYQNLLEYRDPPESARHRNPYREWIGAQIRADVFGWVCPGQPARAAALAWRDARLSHTGNGMYGAMFVAAMVAAAFVESSPGAVVRAGLAIIPEDSRLAEAIRFALSLPDLETDAERAVDRLYERYGQYHWVHTINNAALVAVALLYGDGDFGRSITLAVAGGWDTDCNGATVGSIVGAMNSTVPERWSQPLHNRVRSSLRGFDNSTIDDLARRTAALVDAKRPDALLEVT
jgi:ADP-ribosylglycohydrolase